jgi:hypothetical protein
MVWCFMTCLGTVLYIRNSVIDMKPFPTHTLHSTTTDEALDVSIRRKCVKLAALKSTPSPQMYQ